MQKKIVEFANLLRKSGICGSRWRRPSTPSGARRALDRRPRGVPRRAASHLVKRGDDVPTYDQLFDLYWSGFYDNLKDAFEQAGRRARRRASTWSSCSSRSARCWRAGRCRTSRWTSRDLARALLTGDLSELEQMIRAGRGAGGVARIENMLQIGFFGRRTLEADERMEGATRELRDLAARLRAAGMGDAEAEAIGRLDRALLRGAPPERAQLHGARAPEAELRLHGEVPAGGAASRRASTASPRKRSRACARW
jgi:uncharacterized protein with von Willebrand factor type A (vWA) domain